MRGGRVPQKIALFRLQAHMHFYPILGAFERGPMLKNRQKNGPEKTRKVPKTGLKKTF